MGSVCSSEIPPDADLPEVVEVVVLQVGPGGGGPDEGGGDGWLQDPLDQGERGAQSTKRLMYSQWSPFD